MTFDWEPGPNQGSAVILFSRAGSAADPSWRSRNISNVGGGEGQHGVSPPVRVTLNLGPGTWYFRLCMYSTAPGADPNTCHGESDIRKLVIAGPTCSDGRDNDADRLIDAVDPGRTGAADESEDNRPPAQTPDPKPQAKPRPKPRPKRRQGPRLSIARARGEAASTARQLVLRMTSAYDSRVGPCKRRTRTRVRCRIRVFMLSSTTGKRIICTEPWRVVYNRLLREPRVVFPASRKYPKCRYG